MANFTLPPAAPPTQEQLLANLTRVNPYGKPPPALLTAPPAISPQVEQQVAAQAQIEADQDKARQELGGAHQAPVVGPPPGREMISFERDAPPSPPEPPLPTPPPPQAPAVGPAGPSKTSVLQGEQDALLAAKAAQEAETKGFIADEMLKANKQAEEHALHAQEMEKAGLSEIDRLNGKREKYLDMLARTEIDPDRYFKSQSAASNFMTGISMVMGGILQGAGKVATNPGLDALNRAIDRDIDAQRLGMQKLLQASELTGAQAGDRMRLSNEIRIMEADKRTHYWDMVGRRLNAEAMKRGIGADNIAYAQAQNLIDQQREAAKQAAIQSVNAAAISAMKDFNNKKFELTKTYLQNADKMAPTTPDQIALAAHYGAGGSTIRDNSGRPVYPNVQLTGDKEQAKQQAELPDRIDKYNQGMQVFAQAAQDSQSIWGNMPMTAASSRRNAAVGQIKQIIMKTVPGVRSDKDAEMIAESFAPNWVDDQATITFKQKGLSDALRGNIPLNLIARLSPETRSALGQSR